MTAFTSPGLEKINSLMFAEHLDFSHQHHREIHEEMNSCVFRAGLECNVVNKNLERTLNNKKKIKYQRAVH